MGQISGTVRIELSTGEKEITPAQFEAFKEAVKSQGMFHFTSTLEDLAEEIGMEVSIPGCAFVDEDEWNSTAEY